MLITIWLWCAKSKKAIKLSTNTVNTIDIPPRENVTYSKETQTPSTDIVLDKDGKQSTCKDLIITIHKKTSVN